MRKQLFDSLGATALGLLFCAGVAGQTQHQPPQSVVLIRNARIADGEGGTSSNADVLVVEGKLSRVSANSPAPSGAIVIDAGGGTLALADDGQIKLTPALVASPPSADSATRQTESINEPATAVVGPKKTLLEPSVLVAPSRTDLLTAQAPAGLPQSHGPVRVTPPAQQTSAAPGGTTASQTNQAANESNLAAKVIDPTAPLQTITFQNRFSPSLWGVDHKQNDADFQLSISHNAFGRRNVLRVNVPYQTSSPTGRRGLTDVTAFNIVVFPKKWGAIGAGVVASLGTNKGPGVNTFAAGPAVGLILKKGRWIYGAFNQNLFSFGDIAITQLQPVVGYTLNQKVSFALGDVQYTVDWKKGRFVNVPLGAQVNYIVHFGKQPIRLFVNPQYNLKNEFGSRKWVVTTGFALIVR